MLNTFDTTFSLFVELIKLFIFILKQWHLLNSNSFLGDPVGVNIRKIYADVCLCFLMNRHSSTQEFKSINIFRASQLG